MFSLNIGMFDSYVSVPEGTSEYLDKDPCLVDLVASATCRSGPLVKITIKK